MLVWMGCYCADGWENVLEEKNATIRKAARKTDFEQATDGGGGGKKNGQTIF